MTKDEIIEGLLSLSETELETVVQQVATDRKLLKKMSIPPEEWHSLCRLYKYACSDELLKASKPFEIQGVLHLTTEMSDCGGPEVVTQYEIEYENSDMANLVEALGGPHESLDAYFEKEIQESKAIVRKLFQTIEDLAKRIDPNHKAVTAGKIWGMLNDKYFYRENGILKRHETQWK